MRHDSHEYIERYPMYFPSPAQACSSLDVHHLVESWLNGMQCKSHSSFE